MLNFEKIKKECPKSWELLRGWVKGKIQEMKTKIMQGASLSEEENALFEVNNVLMESTISWQVRSLFDFLDTNKVYVKIDRTPDMWCYSVGFTELIGDYQSRIEAEKAAFEAAFIRLEETL